MSRRSSHVESGSSSVELWDRVARLYDLQRFLEKRALRAAIALAEPRSDDRVLDVGTGTGALLRELARSSARPAEVVGVDASTRMLERARSAGLPEEWGLEVADARSLTFSDERFSLVFTAYLLNVLSDEDAQAALSEAYRVLVPGGRLVVVSAVEPASQFARPYRWLAELLPRRVPWWCAGVHLLDPEPPMRAVGLQPARRRYIGWGYPSVCLLVVRNNVRLQASVEG
jgi:ubiquinone/menaquinone biosynthesis C-methylase UbiE